MKKSIKAAIAVIVALVATGAIVYGVFGAKVMYLFFAPHKGNSSEYKIENVEKNPAGKLNGKQVIFLGSSITDGYGSCGCSFADFLEAKDGVTSYKYAVSGTTLVNNGDESYISRMERIDCNKADAFVCQLSTNDATKNMPLGQVSSSFKRETFDTSTVSGAIEYIISYAAEKWQCPIIFYTSSKYDSQTYGEMVELLNKIKEKWGIDVIDLWNNDEFNDISEQEKELYMVDEIHPTAAGYLKWWLPEFEKKLMNVFDAAS